MKTNKHEALNALVIEHQNSGEPVSVKDAAEVLKVSKRSILIMAEDLDLCVNVGIRVGSGYARLTQGDYTLENLNPTTPP